MSANVRPVPMLVRVLGLLLAVVFLGAQFHYCADLNAAPAGSHVCPLCSTVGSVITPAAPNVMIAPITNRLAIIPVIAAVSLEISHAVSPRAPPAV
ncbi:MAG: hypothetical protein ABLT11_05705 [Candidatus Acidiferrum sp.]